MKILLAVDDSRFSVAAVSLLIAQAKTKGTEIRLLHVVEPFPVIAAQKKGSRESPDFVAARLEQREQAKGLLARAAERFRSAGFKVSFSVEEGDARSIILEYAET